MAKETKGLLPAQEEIELLELWSRRSELDRPGWGRLWTYVTTVLNQCQPRILGELPDSKDEYISSFWLAKVQNENYGSRLDSAKALATFFQRYLIDVQRDSIRRPTSYLDDEAVLDCIASDDCEGAAELVSANENPEKSAYWSQLLAKAAQFFETLTEIEQLFLSRSFCPGQDGEPMYKLAERFKIASYHYKAGQLGIVHASGQLPSDYESTRIGSWVKKTLGLPIERDVIEEVLEAICEAAFRALRGVAHA